MVAVTLIHQALWELASIWAKVTRHLPSGHPGPIQFSCTSGSASPLPNSFSTRTSAFLLHGTDAQSIPLHYSWGDPCCLITYLRHIDSVLISHTPCAAFLEAWSSQICRDSESSSYKTLPVQAEATASPGGIHHFAAPFSLPCFPDVSLLEASLQQMALSPRRPETCFNTPDLILLSLCLISFLPFVYF